MKLYGYWRSSSAWRVRIGLALKGVEVEHVPVHLVSDGGQQHTADHRMRNPLRQVPVLEIDGPVYLSQSLAILTWLDETFPEPSLLPGDAVQRARIWQLAEVVNAGIQPLQNLRVLQKLEARGVDKAAWGREVIAEGLAGLEAMAAATAGRYMVGDQVSLADICLVPQLYNARRFGVELSPLPTLVRVEAACEALDAFQVAHPDRQPDAPTP